MRNPARTNDVRDAGFTFPELLIGCAFVGAMLAVLIAFTHAANREEANNSVEQYAKVIVDTLDYSLDATQNVPVAGSYAVAEVSSGSSAPIAIPIERGVDWRITGQSTGYCLSVWAPGSEHSEASPLVYSSAQGAFLDDADTCTPAARPAADGDEPS